MRRIMCCLLAFGLAACSSWEVDFKPDVIVVGAGMAGLTASVRALELGARVLVLEQSAAVGGSASIAGGSICGAGFTMQKKAGIDDDPGKMYDDFVRLGGGLQNLNPVLAKKHAENSGRAINWLQDYVGVPFGDRLDGGRAACTIGGPASGGGYYFVRALNTKLDEGLEKGKAELYLNTLVTGLIFDQKGAVTGVRAGSLDFKAKSVILATGGYGHSEKWLKEYNFTNIVSNEPNTANGSGYSLARSAGAAFDNMDYCSCYGGAVPAKGFRASIRCDINYNGAVWVNTRGNRVCNEPEASPADRRMIWRSADKNTIYIVLSQSMIKSEAPVFLGMMSNSKPYSNEAKFMELLQGGKYAFKAGTLAELGRLIAAPNLHRTLARYTEDASRGMDSVFGRTKNLVPFDSGPFYAILTYPYLMMTSGGPRISPNAQLLRPDGSAVSGLYLAGEIIGPANIAGRSAMPGIGHSICATWGRIAAESAVKNAGLR
jgi:succinate dehydrogenase/fumarate reductase flavoprotein subunit